MRALAAMRLGLVTVVLVLASVAIGPSPSSAVSGPWTLGTFVPLTGGVGDCPAGYLCSNFKVTACPNVSLDASGELAQASPTSGTPKGVAVFFSGGLGDTWWKTGVGIAADLLTRLHEQDGLVVVQVRWIDSWLKAASGEDAGSAHLACRPATVVKWVHDTIYAPLGLTPALGQCGFCITGNSGGASQVSYALSNFGLDTILNAVIPTGGPPHAAQYKGCLPGFVGYAYNTTQVQHIDLSYTSIIRSADRAMA